MPTGTATLLLLLLLLQSWQTHCELQPLRFLDRELLPHLVFVTRRLAKFIGTLASCELLLCSQTLHTGLGTRLPDSAPLSSSHCV